MLKQYRITELDSFAERSAECFEELLFGCSFRLERITSFGHPSPAGFWYEQPLAEWVLLVNGEAVLADEEGLLHLAAGDYVLIPAGHRHRVEMVSEDAVWLALHFEGK